MSTNIQIDVVLQGLKEQARQSQLQNRSERMEREDAFLQSLNSSSAGSPSDVAQTAASNSLANLRALSAALHSAVPNTYKKRRPAAQRLDTVTISNAWEVAQHSEVTSANGVGLVNILGTIYSRTADRRNSETQRFFIASGDGTVWSSFDYQVSLPAPPAESWTVIGAYDTVVLGGVEQTRNYGTRRVGVRGSEAYRYSTLVLPAGGESFVVIFMFAKAAYNVDKTGTFVENPTDLSSDLKPRLTQYPWTDVTVNTDVGTANYAYLCSRTSVKQLTISADLAAHLEVLNPPPVFVEKTDDDANPATYSHPQLAPLPALPFSDITSLETDTITDYTPEIYWALNQVLNYTTTKRITSPEQWATNNQPVVGLRDKGGFVLFDETGRMETVYKQTQPGKENAFRYGRWSGDPSTIDLNNLSLQRPFEATKNLVLSPNRQSPPTPLYGLELLDTFILLSVSDWGLPQYCRAQLLALGFSATDLQL